MLQSKFSHNDIVILTTIAMLPTLWGQHSCTKDQKEQIDKILESALCTGELVARMFDKFRSKEN